MADNAAQPGSASDLIEITQIRSAIGAQQAQRRTLRALGLRRIRQTVNQPNRPEIRGMLARVSHLVAVRRLDEPAPMVLESGQAPAATDVDAEESGSASESKDQT